MSSIAAWEACARSLRLVIAFQRDRIEELERILGAAVEVHSDLHLTPDQRKIFGMLLARATMTREALFTVMYGNRPECDQPGDLKIIDVQVCKLRQAIKRHCKARGIEPAEINKQWGSHFFMTAANKARGRALLKGESDGRR